MFSFAIVRTPIFGEDASLIPYSNDCAITPPSNDSLTVRRWEGALLVLFVAHILAFALLAPPWRHYDEPTSLEYALLLRDFGRLPAYDEQIPALRSALARSMVISPLFAQFQQAIDPDAPDVILGFNQRVHPPTYYALIALATLPARGLPIELQLQVARLTSVAISAICFYMVVRATRLLLDDVRVQIFVLAVLACLPPFADIMSAMNSDVLANTVAIAVTWAAAALVQQPRSRRLQMTLFATAVMTFAVKRALAAPALLILGWLVVIVFRISWQRVMLGLTIFTVIVVFTLATLPRRLADWEPVPPSAQVVVRDAARSFAGEAAFVLARPADSPGPMAIQEIDPALRSQAAGHIITISAQVRSDQAQAIVLTPAIQVDQQVIADSIIIGNRWTPVSISAYVPPHTRYLAVRLYGPFALGIVFFDDLALVIDSAPSGPAADGLLDTDLLAVTDAHNLLRNPGAERTLPDLAALAPAPLRDLLEHPTVAHVLSTAFFPGWMAAAYPRQISELFQGFWGIFSWGELRVPLGWLLSISLVVGAGMIGALRLSVRIALGGMATPLANAGSWWLCLSLTVIVWVVATLRVHLQPVPGVLIWSFGRYTYAAALPALIVLGAGLHTLLPPSLRLQGLVAFAVFLAIFALVAFVGTLLPGWAG